MGKILFTVQQNKTASGSVYKFYLACRLQGQLHDLYFSYHSLVGVTTVARFSWLPGCRSIVKLALDPRRSRSPFALILMGSGFFPSLADITSGRVAWSGSCGCTPDESTDSSGGFITGWKIHWASTPVPVGVHDFVATLAGFTSLSLDDDSIWFFSHSRICTHVLCIFHTTIICWIINSNARKTPFNVSLGGNELEQYSTGEILMNEIQHQNYTQNHLTLILPR